MVIYWNLQANFVLFVKITVYRLDGGIREV